MIKALAEKKKILIIFPDHWFSYSPTAVNIFNLLSEEFEVWVVALEREINGQPACVRFADNRIHYVRFPRIPRLLWRILRKIEATYNRSLGKSFKKIDIDKVFQVIVLFLECRKIKTDEVIAVDTVGFYVGQLIFKKIHFVSLEITTDDIFYQKLIENVSKIKTLIIQNQERLRLLSLPLKNEQKVFFIQNAPIYNKGADSPSFNGKMIYFGSGNLAMGTRYLFEYFTQYKRFSLTFKGLFDLKLLNVNFPNIKAHDNIDFDDSYTSAKDIQKYLNNYSIGFCFYDFNYIAESSRQNMLHGPSGKIFNYLAAGLPVIALDIPGFKIINDYAAGVLLKEPTPENIDKAIEQIRSSYNNYSANAKKAAKDYCFKKDFLPFLEYVNEGVAA